jgi:localization factor PodJL
MGFEPPAFVLKSPVSDLRDMPAAARFEAWGPAELAMAEPQFAAASQEASDVPDGESVHDPVQHNEDPGSEAAADSAGADGEHPAEDAGAEASDGEGRPISFLASARRSAQAASELRDTKSRGQGKFGISMLMGSGPNAEDRIKRASIALLAATVLLAVVALGANLFLGQSSVVPRAIADSRPRGTAVASADAGIRRSATVSEGQAAAQAAPQPPMATPLDKTASLANAGDARAQLVIGLKYLGDDHTAPRYAEAAKWLGLAAKQGEPLAAYRLGTLYAAGHGVPADAAQAIRWYRAAADAGNRKAMYNLAVAYILGNGVTKNLPEAVRWLSKAANHGLVDAQFDLAVLYERGQGVPQSLLDAYHWYGIAARQGDAESKKRIVALATQISADDRAAAETAIAQFHAAPLNQAANAVP